MNILFVTIAWPKEGDKNLYSDLLEEFRDHDHKVNVACTVEKPENFKNQLKKENGINVLRIKTPKIKKAGVLQKALSLPLLGYKLKKNINKFFKYEQFDLIITNTPPIILSGLMIYLKKKHNAWFYLLLKDIWPHSSVDLKIISKNGLPYRFFRWHEKRIYKAADYIGCMSPMNVDYIVNNNPWINSNKVEECPNSIRPKELGQVDVEKVRMKYNIPLNTTVFIFSGNLSKGHGLKFLVETIKKLKNYDKAYFLIGGQGTQFKYLEKSLPATGSKNWYLYERLPKKEDFEEILMASDVGLILLDNKYTVPQFPSRLLAYFEAGKPALCAVNEYTDIGMIVEDYDCGRQIKHGEVDSFTNMIKYFAENPNEKQKMGQNSKKLLNKSYTTPTSYNIIMEHFKFN